MVRKFILLISTSLIGFSFANASTLFLPGASGIPDKHNETSLSGGKNGCIVNVPTGAMLIAPYSAAFPPPYLNDCLMSFPVNLPAGSTIDGVEIAYRDDSGAPQKSVTAYLASNRIKPSMGAVALAGANDDVVPTFSELYKNMGSLSVPVQNGDIYWIQVSTHRITEFNYVAVTYH
jgi:hypothetical protein